MISVYDSSRRDEDFTQQLEHALTSVLRSGTFIGGSFVESFEKNFAEHVGAKYCVGVGNGLDALRLSLLGLGIGPSDEVIVPAQTFIATWLAVTHVGAIPVPVDISENSGNIDPNLISEAITSKTAAIIAVHLHGQPAQLDVLRTASDRHGVALLEDAAQAHGARFNEQNIGTWGDVSAFSFYPTKNLGALGDSGCIVTDDASLAEKIRVLRSYGATTSDKYTHYVEGWNSRLDPLQAAFLDIFLPHLNAWNASRRSYASLYLDALEGSHAITPLIDKGSLETSAWHHFVITVEEREKFREAMARRSIETDIHYPTPPVLEPAMRRVLPQESEIRERFPNAIQHARSVVSLPMHPWLESDADQVVEALLSAQTQS